MTPTTIPLELAQSSPFSYDCQSCGKCCHSMRVVLSPYEIARLAKNKQLSTRQFIERYTDQGGTIIRFLDNTACPFLVDNRCSVHIDRPAVCRLYPLGRYTSPQHGESFVHVKLHPECQATIGSNGTVATYLESQNLAPHLAANDRYFLLLQKMLDILQKLPNMEPDAVTPERINVAADVAMVADFQDLDSTVEAYCQSHSLPIPNDIPSRVDLHIAAIEEWLATLAAQNA